MSLRGNDPVAQTIFSPDEKNPVYNKDNENQILLSYDKNIKKKDRFYELLIVSSVEKIATSKSKVEAYKYFLEMGCSFAKDLEINIKVSTPTAYRIIKDLHNADLIYPITKLNLGRVPGANPEIYGVGDVQNKEIVSAINRYKRYNSKAYTHVERVYQKSLLEIRDEEIQYSKILQLARQEGSNGFHISFIAGEVTQQLQEKGIRVWK